MTSCPAWGVVAWVVWVEACCLVDQRWVGEACTLGLDTPSSKTGEAAATEQNVGWRCCRMYYRVQLLDSLLLWGTLTPGLICGRDLSYP